MSNKKKTTQQGTRKRKGWTVSLVLLLLLLAAAVVWFLYGREEEDDFNDEDFFDPSAITGILPDMSEEEIEAELNRVVEEGMLNISIASEISFSDSQAKGRADIYNVKANQYIFKVAITLNDTDEVVYESKGIKPGQYIQYIELQKDLAAGEYPATATFTAYTADTHQIVGSAGAELTLYVEK